MKEFLKSVAEDIYLKHSNNLDNICVIFPNQRAGVYFSKFLIETAKSPIFKPKTLTISDIFSNSSYLSLADDIYLIYQLYKIYKSVLSSNDSFDAFYFWGEMLLNDFRDIDKELVNTEDLFKNLKSIKEIENIFDYLSSEQKEVIKQFWSKFNDNKDSNQKKVFVSVWDSLNLIYNKFTSELKSKNIAYEGMLYRELANKIDNNIALDIDCKKIIFVGLNALNKVEQKLLFELKKTYNAEFYWDYDNYYINKSFFEASIFINQNIKKFGSVFDKSEKGIYNNFEADKAINVFSVTSNIGQTKLINNILEKIKSEAKNDFDENEIAIILADEQLLIPTLNSLPQYINNVNITMGYPLKFTPILSLIDNIILLWKNSRSKSSEDKTFYYKDVLRITSHQIISIFETTETKAKIGELIAKNTINIPHNYFNELSTILKTIFTGISQSNSYSEYITNIISEIIKQVDVYNNENNDALKIEKEYLFNLYTKINILSDIIEKEKIVFEKTETYFYVLKSILQNIAVPFTGEPLLGLQVMGILETRVLDFKNLIFISVNEGILPKVSVSSSFIPYNLRKGFGLPTIENQDAIYAYYFYRLIQRAENINIIYNAEQNENSTGEISRYIKQLEYESKHNIIFNDVNFNISSQDSGNISIEKNRDIITTLKNYYEEKTRTLSPSALNTYIDCSLKFYYKYIANIKEPKEIIENVDAAIFGTILHKSLELVYKLFEKENISKEIINKIIKSKTYIEDIRTAFSLSNINIEKQNILSFEIIKKNVLQVLEKDKEYTPFIILGLEKTYEKEINFKLEDTNKSVLLKGNIDRLDQIEDSIRVIDYKTGKAEMAIEDIPDIFDSEKEKRANAVLQTMFYSYVFDNKNNNELIPSVYQIKKIYSKDFNYKLSIKDGKKKLAINDFSLYKKEFELLLANKISDIFNPKINFEQTKNDKHCEYCEFSDLCNK